MEKTKYERLADLAGKYAEAFLAHRRQCGIDAHALLAAAEAYFQAPPLAFRLVTLDGRLEACREQPKNLELIQGLDAFWYFGLALRLAGARPGYSEAMFTIGLKCSPDQVVVRLSRDTVLRADSKAGWEPVLKEIEAGLIDHYQQPPTGVQKPLGFVANASD